VTFEEYRNIVFSDYYREDGRTGYVNLFKELIVGEAFKYTFWMRTCTFLRQYKVLKYSLYIIACLMYRHYTYKFAISIPTSTKIGSGFYIGHFSGIIVNKDCIIGKNCNISQGVTLGQSNRGAKKGAPIIGDNVYIGPGAKLIGRVVIGNNVAIGANSVVTKDIEDNAVVVGAPARVISHNGVDGYIGFTDYKNKIKK
jgi:serine O-acetyltransferase